MHGGSTASWGKIGVLALCAFLIGADGFILAAILPQIADRLNVPLAQAGLLITAFAWVYAVSAPLFGMVLGRWNRRSTLGVAMLVFALGNVLVATAPTYGWMLAARVVSALGSSMATPTAMALAPPPRRAFPRSAHCSWAWRIGRPSSRSPSRSRSSSPATPAYRT